MQCYDYINHITPKSYLVTGQFRGKNNLTHFDLIKYHLLCWLAA